MRRARIICTLGPSTSDERTIRQLVESGMDVARLNFSHGDYKSHGKLLELVRKVSKDLRRPVAVMQDVQGPRVRLGKLEGGSQVLTAGRGFELHTHDIVGDASRASTNYADLANDVEIGESILIKDGRIHLRVVGVADGVVETEVEVGGQIHDRAGLNLPQTALRTPALTAKDTRDVEWGLSNGVDYIALSFVRAALDVHQLRAIIGKGIDSPRIIAKIERPKALSVIDQIIAASDGVMIARGDLGVELPPEQVPMVQKAIIRKANSRGKIAITATQMLESMRSNPTPTRAEASDVANAILDGTDAVMLSGETAMGDYPLEAVQMMGRIVREVEGSEVYRSLPDPDSAPKLSSFADAVATAATAAADKLGATICAFTSTGRTANLLTSQRPEQPIFVLTPNKRVYQRMALYWGVTAFEVSHFTTTTGLVRGMEAVLKERSTFEGDAVVMVMGVPIGTGAEPNAIKLHRMGSNELTTSWDRIPSKVEGRKG